MNRHVSDNVFRTEYRTETIEEFKSRGGVIKKCETGKATYQKSAPCIEVEGYDLPLNRLEDEYIPSFVYTEAGYDAAMRDLPSTERDGIAAAFRNYEQESIPAALRPSRSTNTEEL